MSVWLFSLGDSLEATEFVTYTMGGRRPRVDIGKKLT